MEFTRKIGVRTNFYLYRCLDLDCKDRELVLVTDDPVEALVIKVCYEKFKHLMILEKRVETE